MDCYKHAELVVNDSSHYQDITEHGSNTDFNDENDV